MFKRSWLVVGNFIFIGLFVAILFWWPWAAVPFEVPKAVFFQYFVKILALIFAYKFLTGQTRWKTDKRTVYLVALFVSWAIITAFTGANIAKSFVGNFYRNDGLVTFFHLVGFSFLVSYFWKAELKKKISLTFCVSAVILSLVALFEMATNKFSLGSAATFGNPNFLAGFLAVSLPFTYYLFKSERNEYFLFGGAFISLAIITIGAVSSIITLFVYAIILILFELKSRLKYLFAAVGVLIVAFISYAWVSDYIAKNSQSFIAEGRVRIYRDIFVGVIKRPILGFGWANADYAFESNVWPLKFNNDVYVDKAHSEMLEIAATTGIPGLIIYVGLIAMVFVKLSKSYRTSSDKNWELTLMSTLILFLIHSQTNVISVTEEMIFWLVVGIML